MFDDGQNELESFSEIEKKEEAYKKYISYLVLSLILTTIGSYCGSFLIPFLTKKIFVRYCGISIFLLLSFKFSKGQLKRVLFYVFTFGEGIILAPILSIFTATSIFKCLIATTLIALSFGILGLKFKDLSFLENILFGLLLSILGLSILSIFVPLPFLSYLGLGVFCVYLMYDINSFKLSVNKNASVDDDFILNAVMNIYLDILNIFIYLLKISSKDD